MIIIRLAKQNVESHPSTTWPLPPMRLPRLAQMGQPQAP